MSARDRLRYKLKNMRAQRTGIEAKEVEDIPVEQQMIKLMQGAGQIRSQSDQIKFIKNILQVVNRMDDAMLSNLRQQFGPDTLRMLTQIARKSDPDLAKRLEALNQLGGPDLNDLLKSDLALPTDE